MTLSRRDFARLAGAGAASAAFGADAFAGFGDKSPITATVTGATPTGYPRTMVEGRRYVSLTGDAGLSRVTGFAQQPVSAVVGGQIISSGGNRRPGGGR